MEGYGRPARVFVIHTVVATLTGTAVRRASFADLEGDG